MLWGRLYFAVQAVAGAAWWAAVFASSVVRESTLGELDPVIVAAFDIPLFVGASAAAARGYRPAAIVATGWTSMVAVALAVYATATAEAGWGVLLMLAAACGSVIALFLVLIGRVPSEWVLVGPLAFRRADPAAPAAAHLAATAVQIVVFWGLLLGVIPVGLAFLEDRWRVAAPFPPTAVPVGSALLVLASALGLWSAVAMSTRGRGTPLPSAMPNALVIAGPYRIVRNPMAVAGILQAVAVGVLLSSWLVVAYAIAGALVWNYLVRPLEEADLEARFGERYRRYRSAVRCWWPRFTPVPAEGADRRELSPGGSPSPSTLGRSRTPL
jgi:protein-S-isoprenylcysteine O-methyltransferase Ste14